MPAARPFDDCDPVPVHHAHPPAATLLPADPAAPLLPSRRADGWSAASQRRFLEAIAEGQGVDAACAHVGLSAASAYAFRRTAKGAAFALGWRAATLVARDCVADTLMVRALEGQVDSWTRADGAVVTRRRHDNRLAMALLARLDRQVEAAPDADVKAARLVAQEFDAFLALVDRDEGPARAGLFLARAATTAAELAPDPDSGARTGRPAGPHGPSDATERAPVASAGIATLLYPIYALAAADRLARTGVATAAEVDIADLDPAARDGWSADQWRRAEAGGLLALAHPAEHAPASQHSQHWDDGEGDPDSDDRDDEDDPIWWDEDRATWRTAFPPPDGFDGDEHEERGHIEYERDLTAAEAALMPPPPHMYEADDLIAQAAARDVLFADLARTRAERVAYAEAMRAAGECDAP